ncbi:MAG: rSAM/selenodomain-associated transferase 1 [Cellvibrionaceae bacterium]|jgi:rSAM/selenodomain-associated transferase 1
MFIFPHYQLVVFTKAPCLGKAKTRMQPQLSMEFSLTLHMQLVDYVLSAWNRAKVCPLQLFLAGELTDFSNALPQWQSLPVLFQQGFGLGERMQNAASDILNEKEGLLIVGTDCPFIDKDYLSQACDKLSQYDIVIGPASDGGYVLIGFQILHKEVFESIQWGTESVLSETLQRINQLSLSYFLLPELDDIDHPADIKKLDTLPQFNNLLSSIV